MKSPEQSDIPNYSLDEASRDRIFNEKIVPDRYPELERSPNPVVIFLGGQPGAGKTALQGEIERNISSSSSTNSLAAIGPDLFRAFHPRYIDLIVTDDQRMSFHTNADAGAWVRRAIDLTRNAGSNVALEGTLRQPQITIDTAEGYLKAGYTAELHIPVVHEWVSRLYIARRYLNQIVNEFHGRYTIRQAHDSAYKQLPLALAAIAEAQVMSRIVLHSGNNEILAEVKADEPEATAILTRALEQARKAPGFSTAEMLQELHHLGSLARKYQRLECLRDIQDLQTEIEDA